MIELTNVTKIYNKGKKNEFIALRDINLTIHEGEFVAIMGTSGAGKSSLFYVIGGIENYEEGKCVIDGEILKDKTDTELAILRNKTFGFVMQDFALIEEFTVLENVMLTLEFSKSRRKKKELVIASLNRVGMSGYADKTVRELSGGQKQRVAIARAIVNSPKYILADEPTGALDSENTNAIMQMFEELNRNGQTILVVTHDSLVAQACKRTIVIEDGRLVGDYGIEPIGDEDPGKKPIQD